MSDVFTTVILKLQELGAFNFLFPFMLTTAVFYGLLRKSKLFETENEEGEKVGSSVNAIIALVAGFMVWAYPIMAGINVEQQLSIFFMHGLIVSLVLMIGLMLMGMFLPPDLPKQMGELFKGSKLGILFTIIIVIGVVIFITSGLINLIVGPIFMKIDLGNDAILSVVVLGLLIVPLIFIFRDGGGKSTNNNQGSNEEGG